jgi:hypothetical protein
MEHCSSVRSWRTGTMHPGRMLAASCHLSMMPPAHGFAHICFRAGCRALFAGHLGYQARSLSMLNFTSSYGKTAPSATPKRPRFDTARWHAYDSFHIQRVSAEEEANRRQTVLTPLFSDPANTPPPKKRGRFLAGGGPFHFYFRNLHCPLPVRALLASGNAKRNYGIPCIA